MKSSKCVHFLNECVSALSVGFTEENITHYFIYYSLMSCLSCWVYQKFRIDRLEAWREEVLPRASDYADIMG